MEQAIKNERMIKEKDMTEIWPILTSMKPFIQENWMKSGFEKPTAIQLQTSHLIIEGKDIIAQAPTGTGKTLAYLIPLLEKVDKEKGHIQAVILASSHELVMQIHQEIQKWGEGSGVSSAAFIGGANVKRQVEKLKKHPQVVVGTPGRVNELIKMKKMKMHEVKLIILDEGDQLLVAEHLNTVKSILKSAQKDRQTLLFSATVDGTTEKIAREFMNEPDLIKVEKEEMVDAKVEHLYFVCDTREKFDILGKLARMENMKGLAFIRDIGNLAVMAEKLQYKGISLGVLHSDAKKVERETSLKNFRSGKSPLLLATDVAARGLDITEVTHVINVDIPNDFTQYVHRSGRTGRLGSASGTVISIVTEREERTLKQYAKELGVPLRKQVFYRGIMQDKK